MLEVTRLTVDSLTLENLYEQAQDRTMEPQVGGCKGGVNRVG